MCCSAAEVAEASILATATYTNQPQFAAPLITQMPFSSSRGIDKYPAWTARRRPESALQQADMTWKVPLHEVMSMLAEHLRNNSYQYRVPGPTCCLEGHMFQIYLMWHSCKLAGGGDEYRTSIGLSMAVIDLPGGATCRAFVNQQLLDTRNGTHGDAGMCTFVGDNQGGGHVGMPQLLQLGSLSNAAEGEDRLRELCLVHIDECLVVETTVSHIT
jgi:hypothetical protein